MNKTSIEWTDATWNPVRGCSRVSEGCRNCYAERQAVRFAGPSQPFHGFAQTTVSGSKWTGKVELIEEKLAEPLHWEKPRRIFVNSMSDLFHEVLPDEAIDRVFAVMACAQQHTYQILTKRADRMMRYFADAPWRLGLDSVRLHPNIWLGTSVEDQQTAYERISELLEINCALRFVSYEPALGPVDFSQCLRGKRKLHWVIAGGESGPGARPAHPQWFRNARDQCLAADVPFFFKQWGEYAPSGYDLMVHVGKKLAGAKLDGREWRQFPTTGALNHEAHSTAGVRSQNGD